MNQKKQLKNIISKDQKLINLKQCLNGLLNHVPPKHQRKSGLKQFMKVT